MNFVSIIINLLKVLGGILSGNRFLTIFRNQKGMTLVEVIVAMGISSLIIFAGANLMKSAPNISKTGVTILQEQASVNLLMKSFIDGKQCGLNLAGLVVTAGVAELPKVITKKHTVERVLWKVNETDKNKFITISDVLIEKVVVEKFKPLGPKDSSDEIPFLVNVSFYGTRKGEPVANAALSFMVELKARVNATNASLVEEITECSSSSGVGGSKDLIENTCERLLNSKYEKFLASRDEYSSDPTLDPRAAFAASVHEVEGYCKKPYTFSYKMVTGGTTPTRTRDSLNVQNLKIVNSLFMAVKDKKNKTLDNSLYIGRYIEDTILQKIRLVEKKSGVLECNIFDYSYNRIPLSGTCPTPSNWGDSTVVNGQRVCINLDWVGTGPVNPLTKECTNSNAKAVGDANGPCMKLMDGCSSRPPGSEAYISILTMDAGDLYSANIGDYTIDSSISPPIVPTHIPLEISTAICNYETESPASPNYTCDLNKLGMIGQENPPASGTIPNKLLDHAFYSIKDTEFFSDRKFKTDIKPLEKSSVLKLRPRKYDWRMMKSKSIGFIADELEVVSPELVGNKKGTKNINLIGLIPQLVMTMKEQKSRLNKLEKETDDLLAQQLSNKKKK